MHLQQDKSTQHGITLVQLDDLNISVLSLKYFTKSNQHDNPQTKDSSLVTAANSLLLLVIKMK
jgi:hypothetical protein